tara:strand:+ start:174 stop:389 length:216 start_codon:yes stop_codon:yes gene_type:complete
MLYWGCDGTPFFMKKILLSPVTHINLMLVGILVFIGVLHEHTHHSMKVDVHGYVRQFCRENPDTCKSFIRE